MSVATGPAIEIVGLGPGDPLARTVGSQRSLDAAARIVLRTALHPGLDDLTGDPRTVACDDLYETGATFEDVYAAIARRVCDLADQTAGPVVYAVPGHPWFGERAVALIQQEAMKRGRMVGIQSAVSAFDAVATALTTDLMADEVQILDATTLVQSLDQEPFAAGLVATDPTRPALVCQVYSQHVASAVKLTLGRLYPEDHPVAVVRGAGVPGVEMIEQCRMYELDRRPLDHLTSVWIPGLPALEATRSPYTLQRIVAQLRAPGGCPWDRKQTHASLRDAIIEEAFETVDAIDAGDSGHLAEELGDLLLIVSMHAQIADEAGDFTIGDVYDHVARKLVRRHPHVFGDVVAETPDAVISTWNEVKAAERAAAGKAEPETLPNPLAKLPRSMPALQKARVLYGTRKGETPVDLDHAAIRAIGDELLQIARAAAEAGINPEQALSQALDRQYQQRDAKINSDD